MKEYIDRIAIHTIMTIWAITLFTAIIYWGWKALDSSKRNCTPSESQTQILERLDSIEIQIADYAQQVDALDK